MSDTNKKITSSTEISDDDYKEVKWVGKTKDGKAVSIVLSNAINMGNIEWTLEDKGEVVPEIEFTACYDDDDTTDVEPWEVTYVDGGGKGAKNIVLGLGKFYIGTSEVGLTRGGGAFTVEREFREIEADGDKGPVKGRVTIDKSVAKLKMNIVELLTCIADLYPAITSATVQ